MTVLKGKNPQDIIKRADTQMAVWKGKNRQDYIKERRDETV